MKDTIGPAPGMPEPRRDTADWPDRWTDPEAVDAIRDAAELAATKRGGGA